eukprot:6449642-Amphidinium_carterae.1
MRAREKDNSADARLEMLLQQTQTELPPPQLQDATYRSPSHPPTELADDDGDDIGTHMHEVSNMAPSRMPVSYGPTSVSSG